MSEDLKCAECDIDIPFVRCPHCNLCLACCECRFNEEVSE